MTGRNTTLLSIAGGIASLLLAIACAQSDVGITSKVKARLAADPAVKATQINVDTKDKIVTLSGTVDSEAAKTEALTIARGIEGVKDVVDNISLAGPATAENTAGQSTLGQKVDDAAITAAVKSKLMADSVVGALNIDVDTKDGVVSLTGPVKSENEKDVVVRIARDTSGVKDVQVNLTVGGS